LKDIEKDESYEWIVALGRLNANMQKQFDTIPHIQAIPWISQKNFAELLYDADIIITRGSATTLAEIESFSKKKIIIPLPVSSGNHQYWNAKEYERK
jgi:UDP-N-acetylglucosamine--N-acetylmuramyl-(pentapeptide) pyrophosphoryl-undecaprenol N-acetylglucosamine transferase